MEYLKNKFVNKAILLNVFINFIIIWQCSFSLFINQRREIFESIKYIMMAQNLLSNNTSPHTSYRIGIPFLAKTINAVIEKFVPFSKLKIDSIQPDFSYSLSYYILNLFLSAAIFYILFKLLEKININSLASTILIYIFQLNSTYINMIAIPNTDIAVVFFISLLLYISITWKPVRKNIIFFILITSISVFFKEYIYIAALPSFIGLIKKIKQNSFAYILSIISYTGLFSIFYHSYKIIFDIISSPYSNIRYEVYTKGNPAYLFLSIINPSITFERLHDFIQYNPIIMLALILFSLKSRNFVNLLCRNKNYSFLALIIFIVLTGAAYYPFRIFFPFYIYTLLFIPYSPIISNMTLLNKEAKNINF